MTMTSLTPRYFPSTQDNSVYGDIERIPSVENDFQAEKSLQYSIHAEVTSFQTPTMWTQHLIKMHSLKGKESKRSTTILTPTSLSIPFDKFRIGLLMHDPTTCITGGFTSKVYLQISILHAHVYQNEGTT